MADRAARCERLPARPAARRQEGPDGDGAAQRAAGARAAQDQARLRPHHPLARAGGDQRRPGPGQRPAADRVLRHLAPPGRRRRGLHGRLRGRAGPQERVPPLPDQGLRRPGRRAVHARGDHPPLPPLPGGEGAHGGVGRRRGARRGGGGPGRHGDGDGRRGSRRAAREHPHRGRRAPQAVRVPAAAGRGGRRRAAGRGRPAGAGRAGHRRHRGVRSRQAAGGGVAAGRRRPGGAAPDQRGPVPAPAHPGRGAPLRDHLSARQARQALSFQPPGRRPRSRRHQEAGADQALRFVETAAVGDNRADL